MAQLENTYDMRIVWVPTNVMRDPPFGQEKASLCRWSSLMAFVEPTIQVLLTIGGLVVVDPPTIKLVESFYLLRGEELISEKKDPCHLPLDPRYMAKFTILYPWAPVY